MLSLIICSKNPTTPKELVHNLSQTVGCEYEIIHVDNSKGQYSIFQAYNEGARISNGDILCFMHEDLCFHSKDWGKKVCKHLQDQDIGLLGVAGVLAVPAQGDARMGGYFEHYHWDRFHTLEKNPRSVLDAIKINPTGIAKECAVIDGLWFCMPKSLFGQVRFDEETYKGFHLYDLDISMQVLMAGKKVAICDDIAIEHDSIGVFSPAFADNLELFSKKWKDQLPLQRGISLSDEKMKAFTEKAVSRLKERIRKDAVRVSILDKYRNGDESLTPNEKKMVDRSLQVYWRARFQNAASAKEATEILKECFKEKDKSFKLKMNVLGKYISYGLMRKSSHT